MNLKKKYACGKFIGLAATVAMALSFANACAEAPGKSFDLDMAVAPGDSRRR